MSTATISVPGSAEELYRQSRDGGHSHDQAVAAACRAYDRKPPELAVRLNRARTAWEADQAPVVEPELPPAPVAEPDPFDARREAFAGQIAGLEGKRAPLALSALDDPKAKARLAKLDVQIQSLRADIEHVELARQESARQDAQQTAEADRERRANALDRARELQADREAAAVTVDRALKAAAEALAEHQGVCHLQLRALNDAGRACGWREVLPNDEVLRRALAFALTAGSAPAGWLDLGHQSVVLAAPLSDTDTHPIDPHTSTESEN